jgi:uncharacterized protein YneF (UPF0154 family)
MKKIIYVILWVVLGLILSFIAHAGIEIQYLKYANAYNLTVHWVLSGACALPLWLIVLLPILGIAFGLWAGFFFYRKVYIDHLLRKK